MADGLRAPRVTLYTRGRSVNNGRPFVLPTHYTQDLVAVPLPALHPSFLASEGALRGEDAVAALLVLPDGRYVMQLRDPIARIFYPDHWGCFGGAIDPGESPAAALRRELEEELEFTVEEAREFTRFDFDFRMISPDQKSAFRIYYEVHVSDAAFQRFVLHEGAAFRAFTAAELLETVRMVPYDAFALWLHCRRKRFGG